MVYGAMGIARSDAQGRRIAQLRNWDFFGAPVAGVVCVHSELGPVDSMSVGMFLQTFLLALTERGVNSCVQVSIAYFPDVLREQLHIPDDLAVLCGMSIGYADPGFAANDLHTPRNPVNRNVDFLDD